MHLDVHTLAAAIYALRKSLGETQEGMARRLGCPVSSYVRWEKARSEPGATWVLKMIALAPAQALAAFGLESQSVEFRSLIAPIPSGAAKDLRALRYLNTASEGLNILYELAAAGQAGALETLREFAGRINKRAGDWREMKDSKKK